MWHCIRLCCGCPSTRLISFSPSISPRKDRKGTWIMIGSPGELGLEGQSRETGWWGPPRKWEWATSLGSQITRSSGEMGPSRPRWCSVSVPHPQALRIGYLLARKICQFLPGAWATLNSLWPVWPFTIPTSVVPSKDAEMLHNASEDLRLLFCKGNKGLDTLP